MRAVALSDPEIQKYIQDHFLPLKVSMEPGTAELPLDWPGLIGWKIAYKVLGGEKSNGFTGCMVVSSDLKTQYGATGSANISELFDSIAYNRDKFLAMLEKAQQRRLEEESIRSNPRYSSSVRKRKIGELRGKIFREDWEARQAQNRLPPRKGFHWIHALELFRKSGDI